MLNINYYNNIMNLNTMYNQNLIQRYIEEILLILVLMVLMLIFLIYYWN